MKNFKKILLGTLILVGLQFGPVACLVGGDGRGRDRGRSSGGVWFQDGPWLDGGRGSYGHGDVHPPGYRR